MVFNQHKQTKEDLLWRLREKNSQHFRCFRTECKTPRNSEGKKKKKKFRERKPTLSSSLYPASVGQWFRGHWHSLTSFIKRASVSPWFCYCGRNKLAAGLSACFDSALLLFHCRTPGWHPETLFLGSHVCRAWYARCQLDRATKWLCADPEATIPHTVQLVGAFMHTIQRVTATFVHV